LLKPQNDLKFNDFFAAPAAFRKLRASHEEICCWSVPGSQTESPPNALRLPSAHWRFAPSHRRDAVLSSEHVKHVRGGFVETRDYRVVSDVIRLTRDRAESSNRTGRRALAATRCGRVHVMLRHLWKARRKKSRLKTLLLSGDRQSFYPYRAVAFTGGLATVLVDCAGMECMK
jgi:hypothetical protein